ncbi:MAG: hypothetical protein K2X03_10990 [Bryobacteraceae bacterium]|nr:hypothetical protein [Bryobacteraceae bacterium]
MMIPADRLHSATGINVIPQNNPIRDALNDAVNQPANPNGPDIPTLAYGAEYHMHKAAQSILPQATINGIAKACSAINSLPVAAQLLTGGAMAMCDANGDLKAAAATPTGTKSAKVRE